MIIMMMIPRRRLLLSPLVVLDGLSCGVGAVAPRCIRILSQSDCRVFPFAAPSFCIF